MVERFSWLVLGVALGGCSLALDWDEKGLPCDDSHPCTGDYSCLVDECVAKGSVKKGDTCTADAQCEQGFSCPDGANICTRSCLLSYYQVGAAGCESNEYCRPYAYQADGDPAAGACVPSECTDDNDCATGICVKLSSAVSGCFAPCLINWNGNVFNNCGSTAQREMTCQPMGSDSDTRLVCLRGNATREKGDVCGNDKPCASDTLCDNDVDVVCRPHCYELSGEPCVGTETCTPFLGGDDYAVCRP